MSGTDVCFVILGHALYPLVECSRQVGTLIYVLCILYNLLFKLTNAQYINNKVCITKYSYMFQCIYIIFKESFLIYAKVTISVKLHNQ